jgi:hypothetical protein
MVNQENQGGSKNLWALWRQDENGHRFIVSVVRKQEQAQQERQSYESLRHKQCYWIESHRG